MASVGLVILLLLNIRHRTRRRHRPACRRGQQHCGIGDQLCHGVVADGRNRQAWELVGDRDTGILASLAELIGRRPGALSPPAAGESAKAGPDNDAAEIAPGARQASEDDV